MGTIVINRVIEEEYDVEPCPFCGNEIMAVRKLMNGCVTECSKCNARGPRSDNEIEAIYKWNQCKKGE